jgi:hypothetical protein
LRLRIAQKLQEDLPAFQVRLLVQKTTSLFLLLLLLRLYQFPHLLLPRARLWLCFSASPTLQQIALKDSLKRICKNLHQDGQAAATVTTIQ